MSATPKNSDAPQARRWQNGFFSKGEKNTFAFHFYKVSVSAQNLLGIPQFIIQATRPLRQCRRRCPPRNTASANRRQIGFHQKLAPPPPALSTLEVKQYLRARRPSRLTPVGSCYRSTCRRCFPHSRPTPLPPSRSAPLPPRMPRPATSRAASAGAFIHAAAAARGLFLRFTSTCKLIFRSVTLCQIIFQFAIRRSGRAPRQSTRRLAQQPCASAQREHFKAKGSCLRHLKLDYE